MSFNSKHSFVSLNFCTFAPTFTNEHNYMDALITVQLLAKTEREGQVWRTECGPLVSMLDALGETLCRKTGTAVYYDPGQLIDAQEGCPALRWCLVLSLGKQRLEALHEFLRLSLPQLAMPVPSCTLQWKIEPFSLQ